MKFIGTHVAVPEDMKKKSEALAESGKTPLFFAENEKLVGIIAVADMIKEDSPQAIRELQNMGIHVVMLTGDNERTAKTVGKEAGVDEVIAGVLPDGKESVIRKLKEKGVEVFFEKENIYTLDSKGELLITIMSSLAQEESRSISENVTWGQRKRMADGKVSLPYKHFLGYRKGADGLPEIVPEEADIVRNIYRWFMEGKTPTGIARTLTEQGIPTPAGKEQWCSSTVKSILTNEKYRGSALLQKRFTVLQVLPMTQPLQNPLTDLKNSVMEIHLSVWQKTSIHYLMMQRSLEDLKTLIFISARYM